MNIILFIKLIAKTKILTPILKFIHVSDSDVLEI
jgi:hypothetical protein